MKLIIGLGNPGKEYNNTRHNVGFDALDLLSKNLGIELSKSKMNGLYNKYKDAIIMKPQTFMNLSGDAVQAFVQFFKIELSDILVIYDDMDHATGKVSIKTTGSAGGQNGLKDIIQKLGSNNINRIKIGIGRGDDAAKHVLGKFSKEQSATVLKSIEHAAKAAECFIDNDIKIVMNTFNIKGKEV